MKRNGHCSICEADDNGHFFSPRERLQKMDLLKLFGLGAIETLTVRELDILKYVSRGYSADYIGKELFISRRTVENHIANIKSKLDFHSKSDLINKMQGLHSIISSH